jgi:hypothetical protein
MKGILVCAKPVHRVLPVRKVIGKGAVVAGPRGGNPLVVDDRGRRRGAVVIGTAGILVVRLWRGTAGAGFFPSILLSALNLNHIFCHGPVSNSVAEGLRNTYRSIERIIERSNKRSVPKDGAFYTSLYFLSLKPASYPFPSFLTWSVGRTNQPRERRNIHSLIGAISCITSLSYLQVFVR